MATEETIYVASVVSLYWFVSISMVYLNKVLMSNEGISISAPLFVTWYQCMITTLICWLAGKCGERASQRQSRNVISPDEEKGGSISKIPIKSSFLSQFPKVDYSLETALRVFPLSVIFVCMITFNNLCLKWVEVSFYNVARSFTIVFNVIFSFAILGMPSSCKTVSCLMIVIAGFLMGSVGEINFSVKGTISGIMSSVFVSLNSIFTKKMLPVVDDNHWRLTFYNNSIASLLFIPLICYFESDVIMAAVDKQLVSSYFWSFMTLAGFFGFSIGIVTVLQIKATSPLTHNISGTAKAALQSLGAFYIWGNEATFLGVTGIFTVLGGSLIYAYVKIMDNRKKQSTLSTETAPIASK